MTKLIPLVILVVASLIMAIMRNVTKNIGSSNQPQSTDGNVEVFAWPGGWWFIVGMTALVILFGFILIFSQWSVPGNRQALIFIGSMCSLFLFCLIVHIVRHVGYQVTLDKHGITEHRYGKSKIVAWVDIVRVQTSQILNMRKVRVFGKDGTILELEYQLEKIDSLIEILREHGWSL